MTQGDTQLVDWFTAIGTVGATVVATGGLLMVRADRQRELEDRKRRGLDETRRLIYAVRGLVAEDERHVEMGATVYNALFHHHPGLILDGEGAPLELWAQSGFRIKAELIEGRMKDRVIEVLDAIAERITDQLS